MKFKAGDKVWWKDAEKHQTGIIDSLFGNSFCIVSITEGGLPIGVGAALSTSKLTKDVTVPEGLSKLKMEFALEQNFKEVMQHIEDGTHRLVSQEMQHNYDKRDKEHVISINLILKENK